MTTHPVASVHLGANAGLIEQACRLYAPPGSLTADVTYESGRFWRKAPPGLKGDEPVSELQIAVDDAPVPDHDDRHHQGIVVYVVDHPVVP